MFEGAALVTIAVAAETDVAFPDSLVAVTATRIVEPMSAVTTVYVESVAAAIALQFAPDASQRRHS